MSNCADKGISTGATGNLAQVCARIDIDINGPNKGPNRRGRDSFIFWVSNGRGALLYPAGGRDDTDWWRNSDAAGDYASCYPGNKDGWTCAGRVMEEGWEMNY